MTLVRPTDNSNVVPATVAAIDQLDKLTGMLNILLAGGITAINVGNATCTFPGGSQFSSTTSVVHGIPTAGRPRSILVTMNQTGTVAVMCVGEAGAPGVAGTFQLQAQTIDASTPALGVTVGFDWVAFN